MSKSGKNAEEKETQGFGPPRDPMRAELKAYLDGELSLLRQWTVRRHLARCAECRQEMAWMQQLSEELRTLERATPRPELRTRILANLPPLSSADRTAPATLPHSTRASLPRFALGGALAALAVGVFAITRVPHLAQPTIPGPPPQVAVKPNLPTAPEDRETNSRIAAANPPESPMGTPQPGVSTAGSPPIGHFARDPFRPASTPPTPQEIASNRSSAAVPGHSDGTYDAALKLFKERVAVERAEERRRYQEMLGVSGPSAARKTAPAHLAPPVRLSLAANNPGEVRDLLQALVQKMNGTVTVARASSSPSSAQERGSKAPATVGDPGPVHGPEPDGEPALNRPGATLLVRVPAQNAQALLHTLERIGTLRPDTPSSAAAQPAFPLRHDFPLPTTPGLVRAVPGQPTTDGSGGDSNASSAYKSARIPPAEHKIRPQMARQAKPKLPKADYLTIVIRLHSGQALAP